MKRLVLAGAIVTSLVLAAPLAAAQTVGPGSQACENAQAAVGTAQADLDAATDAAVAVDGLSLDLLTSEERDRLLEEGTGNVDERVAAIDLVLDLQSSLDADVAAELALVAEVCADPVITPPDVTPTPTPPPGDDFVDLDCDDFPLPDGRTAQDVFDEDPSDPHRLDRDDDGVACEIDEDTGGNGGGSSDGGGSFGDFDSGGDFSQLDAIPRGSVATGGGPA